MKRSLDSSDSLGAFMSTDEHNNNQHNPMYTREFQSMMMMDGLDEEEICVDESCGGQLGSEKKRRLRVDQVKALEKNFEVENKLEPERKVKLAEELGLQPRQVAVWFQNRRARWKTKQLERDYGVLKADYDALKLNYEALQRDNQTLLKEIREIKSKCNEDGQSDGKLPVKEEPLLSDTEENQKLETESNDQEAAETKLDFENHNGLTMGNALIFGDLKDGSSDSDSSAILNEDNNSPIFHHQFLDIHNGSSSSSMNISFGFSGSKANLGDSHKKATNYYLQPKIEEHNFFGEESCSTLFCDDQAPTLHWYSTEDWN